MPYYPTGESIFDENTGTKKKSAKVTLLDEEDLFIPSGVRTGKLTEGDDLFTGEDNSDLLK